MTRPQKALAAAADPGDLFEFSGTITDYWSYTMVRDYVMLMPGVTHTAYRLYSILRSMMVEASRQSWIGMRRMTIDQLCWLVPGPNDKPMSISSMYETLKTLEKLDLVVPKDVLELEGITQLKGKDRAAKGISRGFTVNDLPPDAVHTGWRNAWDKLDAYRPDWRENPPQPPTHLTETQTSPNGQVRARVRLVDANGRPFQKTGTPQVTADKGASFQKTGMPVQKSGTAVQKTGMPARKSGTDLPLTSGNDHPLRSSLKEASPSPAPGAPSAPAVRAELEAEERETAASPSKAQPEQSAGPDAVAEQFAVQWKQRRGTRPSRRQVANIAAEAAEAIADGDTVEWLGESVIPFMVGRGYLDLGRAKTHPQCPAPAASSSTAADMCPKHPRYRAGSRCVPCVMA